MLKVIGAVALLCLVVCRSSSGDEAKPAGLAEVQVVCVDEDATGYATFQSYNQKVVANRHGIFMSYIRSRNDKYTAQTWRLLRSTDTGSTFSCIYEDTHATNPPVLETDEAGNVYLMRVDWLTGNAYLYRFLADKGFSDPVVSVVPGGAAGKYCMVYDRNRHQLYFFAHNGRFYVIGLDGDVRYSCQLLAPGAHAYLMYPLLSLGEDGTLHAAWTTQKRTEYMYWDIHHMLSPDGGKTWRNLDGSPLTPPVIADDTGPALRITLDDEFDAHTWLSSFLVKAGKVHFLYQAQTRPPRQHYVRYDVQSGRLDWDRQPEFRGSEIQLGGLSGFFASDSRHSNAPLYCVMQDQGYLACLASNDNGKTWHDYARGEQRLYPSQIGGCRQVTADGYIIGSFTSEGKKVYFFKIKAQL